MSGETNLGLILNTLKPELNAGEYVFCCVDKGDLAIDNIIGLFKEKEGWTMVLEKSAADERQLKYDGIFAWITLTVHSSLNGVGLTAAFSNALAKADIGCNVIAGFYHDHLFVPKGQEIRALEALQRLSAV